MGYMVCRRNVANYSVGMHAEHSNFSLSLLPPLSLHLRLSFESHKMVTRCIVKQVLNNLQMLEPYSTSVMGYELYTHKSVSTLFSPSLSEAWCERGTRGGGEKGAAEEGADSQRQGISLPSMCIYDVRYV